MSTLAILTKCPLAKCPLAKCPLAKCRLAKCPLAKCHGFMPQYPCGLELKTTKTNKSNVTPTDNKPKTSRNCFNKIVKG